jgi:hypothetical protein
MLPLPLAAGPTDMDCKNTPLAGSSGPAEPPEPIWILAPVELRTLKPLRITLSLYTLRRHPERVNPVSGLV